jgi:hypothetical protein
MARIAPLRALPRAAVAVAATAIAALPLPALADVTAEEVWSDWQDLFALTPESSLTTTSETRTADRLTVRGLAWRASFPEGSVALDLPEIAFTEAGNGTVAVTVSPEYPVTIVSRTPEGGQSMTRMTIFQEGATTLVSGDPGALTYDVISDASGARIEEILENGVPLPVEMSLRFENLRGSYASLEGALRSIEARMRASGAFLAITGTDPDTGETFQLDGALTGLEASAETALPEGLDEGDTAALLGAGFTLDLAYGYDAAAYAFDLEDDGDSAVGTFTNTGGGLEMALDANRLRYASRSRELVLELVASAVPFPLSVRADEARTEVAAPLGPVGGEPQPFGLDLAVEGFAMSDGLWNLFDPGEMLPRDPARLAIDLAGTARVTSDPAADPGPQAEPAEPAPVPYALTGLTIENVVLAALGARFSGQGLFSFDPDDLGFFGMPRPAGTLTMRLTGGNTLLDTLVSMGLVPEENAVGMRIGIGAFAVAEPGAEDTLTSTIEFTEDGRILANGQRIQ